MFENREKAGEALTEKLKACSGPDTIIYALPRGGVPVAAPVAIGLEAPLSLLFVKKICAPGHAELAIGATVDGVEPIRILHDEVIAALHVSDLYVSAESETALNEIERQRARYSGLYARVTPKGKTVIIVDDGLATGATMEVAIEALKQQGARKIIVAVPVASSETISRFETLADEVVCVSVPSQFWSVGEHYSHFPQLSDADVMEILNELSSDGDGPSLVRRRA
ncbi:MAG: phosphoribosyltransferase family protein [Pseudomonadota bacterium]